MTTKAELQKQINELRARIDNLSDDMWPKTIGDNYWCLDALGAPFNGQQTGGSVDDIRIKQGNCFRTKKDAELKARQNIVLQQMRVIAGDWNPNWDDRSSDKNYIYYDHEYRRWWIGDLQVTQNPQVIFFETSKIAQQAIDTLDLDVLLEVVR